MVFPTKLERCVAFASSALSGRGIFRVGCQIFSIIEFFFAFVVVVVVVVKIYREEMEFWEQVEALDGRGIVSGEVKEQRIATIQRPEGNRNS